MDTFAYKKGAATGIVIALVVIVLIVIGIVVARSGDSENNGSSSAALDQAPAFELQDYDGNTFTNADIAGKVAILNSWATWCPFCVDELPDFATLQEEFGDELVVVAIDRAESLERAKRFTDDLGVTDRMVTLLDPKDSFYASIGGFSMPETLFVAPDGTITLHKRGPLPLEEMRVQVNQILAEQSEE